MVQTLEWNKLTPAKRPDQLSDPEHYFLAYLPPHTG